MSDRMRSQPHTSRMASKTATTTLAAATLCAVLLAGCDSTEQVAGVDRGGNPVAVVTKGEITGFGSVIVNGVRYDTGSAEIVIDGEPGTEAGLSVGAVVTLRGERVPGADTGNAIRIEFDDSVEGPVDAVDAGAGTAVVLGRTVHVSIDTLFEGNGAGGGLDGLAAGDAVEVSGFDRADGSVEATLIRLKAEPDRLELSGVAAQVDTAAQRLRIGGALVDYGSAMLDGFPDGAPANGDRVEARGSERAADGTLIAETLSYRQQGVDAAAEGEEAKIEGLITRFASAADFDVDGQPVATDDATVFEGGNASMLGPDVRVEVEGTVTGTGAILAERVRLESPSQARLDGTVDDVDVDAGTLTAAGVTVLTDAKTGFRDASSQRQRPFSLGDIGTGDRVEAAGTESGDALLARSVTRTDADAGVVLRARARDVAQPRFVLLGVTVVTDATTEFEADGQPSDAAAFYAAAEGRDVEVEGTLNGDIVAARVRLLTD
ncbi:DUF5666 domain-containing protein [Lentisalinibacter salinarum]|uniref:DUF5666 domain-containing protein n=1 Tax=Lentisalinibacter salinarum TaxID=2992239 RepID=UPI00386F5C1F